MNIIPPKPENESALSLAEFLEKFMFTVTDFAKLCYCCRLSISTIRDHKKKPSMLLLKRMEDVCNGWVTEESIKPKDK